MKTKKFSVEATEDGFWTYKERNIGKLPGKPLHSVLEWILQQLNFGNCHIETDECGEGVTLVCGMGAAPSAI